jgi:hypothetical protein
MTACLVAEFSCCVPHWCLIYDTVSLSTSQNTDLQGGRTQDILPLKGTKQQLSVYDKMPMVYRFFHACLTFQFST